MELSAFHDEFTPTLISIMSAPQPYWEKLSQEIRYLKARVDLIMDTKIIDDVLTPQYGTPLAFSPVQSDVRLGLLYLDQILGTKRVMDFLDRKPVALIISAALISIYRSQWFVDGKVQTCEFLRTFFNVFVTMEAHIYNPDFFDLVQNNEKAALEYVLEKIVKEIDTCELNQFQRWELITSLRNAAATTVSTVNQL